jgi:hypothetical protein
MAVRRPAIDRRRRRRRLDLRLASFGESGREVPAVVAGDSVVDFLAARPLWPRSWRGLLQAGLVLDESGRPSRELTAAAEEARERPGASFLFGDPAGSTPAAGAAPATTATVSPTPIVGPTAEAEATATADAKVEALANSVKARLGKGADFAALAKEKSTEPSAKDTGGDLGTFGPGKMVPEFDKVVFAMKKGEISQPFQSQFGWHVAQVLDVQGTEPTFASVKDDVTQAYITSQVQEKMSDWLTNLQDQAKITNTLKTDTTTK